MTFVFVIMSVYQTIFLTIKLECFSYDNIFGLDDINFCFVFKKRYEKLNEYILPELVRCPLTRIGLTIKLLKLGSIHTFLNKTIDPPSATAINNTIALLQGKMFRYQLFNKF